MLYGVMLVYYEDFHVNAIKSFDILLKKIDPNSKLIVVSNNFNLKENYIQGDNTNWEFSGWDKALATINLLDTDSIIFANDTFMYNNPYGRVKKIFVERIFSYVYNKNKIKTGGYICGSTSGLEHSYEILNFKADYWVSTYLFLMSGKLVNELGNKISMDLNTLDSLVKLDNKKFIFDNSISKNMQEHLQEWLYPKENVKAAWYKATTTSDDVKIKKVKTILNEKYLSAFCKTNNGKIIDINPKKLFFRIFNKSYCA